MNATFSFESNFLWWFYKTKQTYRIHSVRRISTQKKKNLIINFCFCNCKQIKKNGEKYWKCISKRKEWNVRNKMFFFCFFVCVFSVPESDPCGGGKISNLFGKIIFCFTLYLESNVNCLHNFSSEKFWSLFFVNLLPHMSIILQAMKMRFWKKNDCKLQVRSKLSVVVPPKK